MYKMPNASLFVLECLLQVGNRLFHAAPSGQVSDYDVTLFGSIALKLNIRLYKLTTTTTFTYGICSLLCLLRTAKYVP